jgi:hypothetical protein
MHFTPTSGSWRKLVGTFFGIIQRRGIKRGTFASVKDLIAAFTGFSNGWNLRCDAFTLTKTPDEMLAKATREGISDARHQEQHPTRWAGVLRNAQAGFRGDG